MPYHSHSGILKYQPDLLRKDGYSRSPKTWDEPEKMALQLAQARGSEYQSLVQGYTALGSGWQQ